MDNTSSMEESIDEHNGQLEKLLKISRSYGKSSTTTPIEIARRKASKRLLDELTENDNKNSVSKSQEAAAAKMKEIQDKRRVVKKKNPFELDEDFGKKDVSLEEENVNDNSSQATWGFNEKTLSEEDMDIAKSELADNDALSEQVDLAISSSKKEDLKETPRGKEYIDDDDLDFDEDEFGPDCFFTN